MSEINYGGHTAEELKALVEAATPGEWMWTDSPDDELEVLVALESSESLEPREVLSDRDGISQAALRANYDLIAAARNALPDLLARIEQLEAELAQQWLSNHFEHCGRPITEPWPHSGDCHWPLPEVLRALPKGDLELLLGSKAPEPQKSAT